MTSQLNVQRFIEEAQRLASNGDFQPAFRRPRHNIIIALSVEKLPYFRGYPLFHLSIHHPIDKKVEYKWVIPIFVVRLGEPQNVHDVALSWSNERFKRPGIVHHFFWKVPGTVHESFWSVPVIVKVGKR